MKRSVFFVVVGLVGGFIIGKVIYDKKPPQETFAQEIKQKDGSLVLERNPFDKPKKIVAPDGAEIFRQANFIVNPTSLDKMNLTVSIVKMPDDTLRTIVKTDNGQIIGGTDIPVDSLHRPINYDYTAGFIIGKDIKGLFLQRDFDRFSFGLDICQKVDNYNQTLGYNVRMGYRF